MDIVSAGIVAAIAMIFLFMKLDIRKVCGYDVFFDISFTLLLAWMFSGTYSGMVAALLGGALLSIVLFITKRVYGYKKLTRKGLKLQWEEFI